MFGVINSQARDLCPVMVLMDSRSVVAQSRQERE
jgi:hypothetical protein